MFSLRLIWAIVRGAFAKRVDLVAENLALRQQLIVFRRRTKRLRLRTTGRVVADQLIALSGASGTSLEHLHFGVASK